MSIDEQHVAMPKLYGAPAYGRPPGPVETVARPFDPDELPIEADQTEEEREFAATLPARAYAPGGIDLSQIGRSESKHEHGTPAAGLQHARDSRQARPRLTVGASARAGVASPDGGVAQSVRAAGLYPAGSRFESWLPYQSPRMLIERWLSPRRPRSPAKRRCRRRGSREKRASTSGARAYRRRAFRRLRVRPRREPRPALPAR